MTFDEAFLGNEVERATGKICSKFQKVTGRPCDPIVTQLITEKLRSAASQSVGILSEGGLGGREEQELMWARVLRGAQLVADDIVLESGVPGTTWLPSAVREEVTGYLQSLRSRWSIEQPRQENVARSRGRSLDFGRSQMIQHGSWVGAGTAIAAVWVGFWFWAFSFAYSASFFSYNLCSRLPTFMFSLMAAVVIPASALMQWSQQRRDILPTVLTHSLATAASLCPLAIVSIVLSRVQGPCHLSGDDAMGVGIDFLMLAILGAVSIGVLTLGLAARKR